NGPTAIRRSGLWCAAVRPGLRPSFSTIRALSEKRAHAAAKLRLKGEIGKAFPRERRGPEQEVTFRIQKTHSAPEINPRQYRRHRNELFFEHNHHKINAAFIVNDDVFHASKS